MAEPIVSVGPGVVDIRARPGAVPLRELLPWVLFAGVLLLMLLYFVGVEQGATSLVGGRWMHEFVHDARHVLAVPCH